MPTHLGLVAVGTRMACRADAIFSGARALAKNRNKHLGKVQGESATGQAVYVESLAGIIEFATGDTHGAQKRKHLRLVQPTTFVVLCNQGRWRPPLEEAYGAVHVPDLAGGNIATNAVEDAHDTRIAGLGGEEAPDDRCPGGLGRQVVKQTPIGRYDLDVIQRQDQKIDQFLCSAEPLGSKEGSDEGNLHATILKLLRNLDCTTGRGKESLAGFVSEINPRFRIPRVGGIAPIYPTGVFHR